MKLSAAALQPGWVLLIVLLSSSVTHARSRDLLRLGRVLELKQREITSGSQGVVYVANTSDPAAASIRVPTVTLSEALKDPNVTVIMLLTNYTAGAQGSPQGEYKH